MKKIALIYGGRSYEHEISVLTAIQAGTFFPKKYKLIPVYMKDGKLYYKKDYRHFSSYLSSKKDMEMTFTKGGLKLKSKVVPVDCALVCTHGGEGEDGTLSAMLEYYDIPYTCSDLKGSIICMDKRLTKTVLKSYGFNTVDYWNGTDYPCILKPSVLGSSIGIKVAKSKDEFDEAVKYVSLFGDYIVEPLIENPVELNCAVFGRGKDTIVSCVEKPLHSGNMLDFDDKYRNGEREIPAVIDGNLEKEIKETSREIYRKLGLFGVVRIDYLYKDGRLYVNEINSIPGSLSYYLFSPEGYNFTVLIEMLVEEGIARGNKVRPVYKTDVIKEYANGFKGSKTKA